MRAPRTGTNRRDRGCRRGRGSGARVLGPGGPLEHRLGQVAGLGCDGDERTERDRRRSGRRRLPRASCLATTMASDDAADDAAPGLVGRDVVHEATAAPRPPGSRRSVERPDGEDAAPAARPGRASSHGASGAVGGNGRCVRRGSAGRKRQHADVEGPEDGAQPGQEAIAEVGSQERADGGDDDAQPDQDPASPPGNRTGASRRPSRRARWPCPASARWRRRPRGGVGRPRRAASAAMTRMSSRATAGRGTGRRRRQGRAPPR